MKRGGRRIITVVLTVSLLITGLPIMHAYADTETYPEKFSLRDKGVITPVKQQRPWGTCWGFAATAASEGSILTDLGKTYGTGENQIPLDLSEKQLAWFIRTPVSAIYDYGDNCVESQRGEGMSSIAAETASPQSMTRQSAAVSVSFMMWTVWTDMTRIKAVLSEPI